MTLTRSEREKLLAKIRALVEAKFYDPQLNNQDWNGIVEKHKASILDADSPEDLERAITQMLNELHSSGLGLLGPSTKITPRNAINASFRSIATREEGSRWVFQDVLPGGVAQRAQVRPGDALVSINGQDITPPVSPVFAMGEKIPIVISRNGQRKDVHLELTTPRPKYKDNPYSEPHSLSTEGSQSQIGVLKVSLFPGKIGIDFANQLSELLHSKLSQVDRLVIDLRGNPGGGVGNLRLMSYLTPGKQPVGYSLDRPTAEKGYSKEKLPRFDRIPRSKLAIASLALKFGGKKSVVLQTEGLGKQHFQGKIVMLINEHSTGAAEMVAQFAKENQLATLIGAKTPGHLVARSAFPLGFGYRIVIPIGAYISWQGNRIEGKGIEPDVLVDWSYSDALAGSDNQLQAALSFAQTI